MTQIKYLYKAVCSLGAITLMLTAMGCPGGKSDTPSDQDQPSTAKVTLQMIYDEAAKGPGRANIPTLRNMYDVQVIDSTKADELSEISTDGKDHFLCKLLKLPQVADVKSILADFLPKLSRPVIRVNDMCNDGKPPFALILDPA